MDLCIHLAYDGSINGDWIARYAIHLAEGTRQRRLVLHHVLDGSLPTEAVDARIGVILADCRRSDVQCVAEVVPRYGSIAASLLSAIDTGSNNLCICGTRIRARNRGMLSGTVSEALLESGRVGVLALRVVNPGLLGHPVNLLFALAGHPRGFRSAMPLLRLFGTLAHRIHLLHVMPVHPLFFRGLTWGRMRALHAKGYRFVRRVEAEIEPLAEENGWQLDSTVVLSDDWSEEIPIQASRQRAELVLLGWTERSLPGRIFSTGRLERILAAAPCDTGIYRSP